VFANTVAATELAALPPVVVTVKKMRVLATGELPLRSNVADSRTALQFEAAGGITDSKSTSTLGAAVAPFVSAAAVTDVAGACCICCSCAAGLALVGV
jgi:hypothetical protein